MKWNQVRKDFPDKWILFEAMKAHSEEGKRIVDELAVINIYDNGKDALKEYADRHKKGQHKELYVYHTKNQKLIIEERNWIGVRKNG